jgi:hypothetical protein
MAGTFVAAPSKALTIEHESRDLTHFSPVQARIDLDQIEVLSEYGAKLRDDTKLYELAVKKLEIIVDIITWWGQHVPARGKHSDKDTTAVVYSQPTALEALGYSPKSNAIIDRWRALSKAAEKDTDAILTRIVNGWKMRAGMMAIEPKPKKENEDRDLAVEAIFRAYTKLDPDQRIELKQKIMAFEKSYKDPFAPKAA